MKRFFVSAIALAAASLAAGCYIDLDDGVYSDGYGDLDLTYTFDGLSCDLAGVDRLRISIDGRNRGDAFYDTVRCGTFRDGIIVYDLLDDHYDVYVEGLGAGGSVIYSMDRPLIVRVSSNVNNIATVNLYSSTGDLLLNWAFPDGRGCAGIDVVQVTLRDPSGVLYDSAPYACTFGGVQYDRLSQGRWSVRMEALDAGGRTVFRLDERVIEVVDRAFNEYTLVLND